MVRMQVQIPNDLYDRLRAIAEANEWSFAETLRRAGEILARMYPNPSPKKQKWTLPTADIGRLLAPEENWAEILEMDQIGRHLK